MIFGAMEWVKLGAAAALGAAVVYLPFVSYGKSLGRADVIAQLQEDRVAILKDGKRIDEEVYSADDAYLCTLLGGCGLSDSPRGNKPL